MNAFGPYFTEHELKIEGSLVPASVRTNMYLLVKLCLNRLRKQYGPITITSGYRSPEENEHLRAKGYNPSNTSQHMTGEAVDFLIPGKDMRQVFEDLKTWWPGQTFFYAKKGHVHVALPTIELEVKGRLYAKILEQDN